jgi:uncharacterized repeat protein (TIGR01451 family)
MELVDIVDPVETGRETQYQVILRNTGSVQITNLRVTALVPEELTAVRAQAAVDYQKIDRRDPEPERIVFTPLVLPPGQDTVYRVFVRAVKAGDARFRVELAADQLTAGPLVQEESTTVFNPRQP